MKIRNLLAAMLCVVVNNRPADIQEKFDFKTFDPVAYFKRDLPSFRTNQPKKIEVEKYCDRLHQFLTLLLYQERLIKLFCKIIPAIGPSEKYEQYAFINGLVVKRIMPKKVLEDEFSKNFAGKEVIDEHEINASVKSGEIGIRLIESMPAMSLRLSIGKLSKIKDVDPDQIGAILQKAFSNPENDEVKKTAGGFLHTYYFASIEQLLSMFEPAILRFWFELKIAQAKQDQPIAIASSESYLKRFFPDVSTIIPGIPLFSEVLIMYEKLAQAHFNSRPVKTASLGKITAEFKDVKNKMGGLLDKMQKYTGLISRQYERAKADLATNRKSLNDLRKYVRYRLEYFPPYDEVQQEVDKFSDPEEEVKVEELVKLDELNNTLDFSCIHERTKPKKNVESVRSSQKTAEESKHEPISELSQQPGLLQLPAAASVAKDIPQKNQELKEAESKIVYDQRILNWLNPEFMKEKDPHSILYHTFSFLIDPIIKKYGKRSEFVSKDRTLHPTYHLAGEIAYLAGPKQNKKELYVFVNTYDPRGILYHRGIEPIKQGENFFQDFFSKSYMNIQDQPIDLQAVAAPTVGQDALLSENDYSILVHDGRNNVNITLLKPFEGLSYN